MSVFSQAIIKVFGHGARPLLLTDGQAVNIDARGMGHFTVITGAGATATVSRVDDMDATSHTTGTQNQYSVAANTLSTIETDWPFYRVSVAGGSLRCALGA